MGIFGTTGRLIELRQPERRLELKAPRLLLLCNRDGGEERFLRWRSIRRIALEQNLAADAVEERIGPMFAGLARERQRFVNPRQGFFRVLSGLNLREKTLEQRNKQLVLIR